MFLRIPGIEPEIWTKEMIQKLSTHELKMLMGFCETILKVRAVATAHGSYEADAYCLAVQMK